MNLNKEYTDPSKPGAFAGFDGFYKALKKRKSNISREKVQKFLEGQETYTLHKPKLKNKIKNVQPLRQQHIHIHECRLCEHHSSNT